METRNSNFFTERPKGFLVVGIGASAGGIQALREFFEHVPGDSNMAYVVILHLSPDHDSKLSEILETVATVPVSKVTEKTKIEPNHIYVVSPNQHLIMQEEWVIPSINLHVEERRAPVDVFFRTLADSHGPRAICVVLSGTGANGSMGLKRIKEMGGVAYAQNPREAEFNEMPRNAIATELVDEVLPVSEIPTKIIAYRNRVGTIEIAADPESRSEQQEHALRQIFTQLRIGTGHDFSNYKRPTMLRRIERRINIRNLPDLPTYATYVHQNPEEVNSLLRDLLISVTNFFRDRKSFEEIEQKVLPAILKSKKPDNEVRIWVAGCATGEEAYSIAMLVADRALRLKGVPKVQIFATDIDETAIATAREGRYTLNDAADVSPDRLVRFFQKEGETYRVKREIREMVIFANHNFLNDPPFSHIDLITCRNVLIYLNSTAQEKVLETFHFALNPGGFLFLGSSEGVDGSGDLFAAVSREHHIYQAREVSTRNFPLPHLAPSLKVSRLEPPKKLEDREEVAYNQISAGELHQKLVERYAPPSVVINEDYDIIHMSEKVVNFFTLSGGEPTRDLLKLVRPELRLELRSALFRAVERQTAVEARNITWDENGESQSVTIHVKPVTKEGDTAKDFILVIFDKHDKEQNTQPLVLKSDEPVARHLEEELVHVKTQLKKTVDHHLYQEEELKASNEELQAMVEELRSATEELETSREELQSINEELRTVNQELKVKIEEISISSNNLQNLINSAELGTIFLDSSFCTRLYTPAILDIFNLIPSDYGRPLSDITHRLEYGDLVQDAHTVLQKLTIVEREVTTTDKRSFLMRVLPYRTSEDRINGVVMTFFNITKRKVAELALQESEQHLRLLIESATDFAIFTQDPHRYITTWNQGAEMMMGYLEAEIIGKSGDILFTPEDRAEHAPDKEAEHAEKEGRAENERWHVRKDGSRFWGSGSVSPIRDNDGKLLGFVKIMRDLTERKQAQEALMEANERMVDILEGTSDAFYALDADFSFTYVNSKAASLWGRDAHSLLGKHYWTEFPLAVESQYYHNHYKVLKEGKAIHFETVSPILKTWIEASIYPGKNGSLSVFFRDISQRKKADEALSQSEARFRTLADTVPQVIWTNDHEGKANYFNQRWYEYTGLTFEESFALGWEAIVHPDDAAASVPKWRAALEVEEIFDTEFRLRNKEGAYRWHIGRNVPLKDASGKITGWFGTATDIENLKRTEDQLRSTSERLHIALQAGQLGSFEYDFKTNQIYGTTQLRETFGYSPDEPISYDNFIALIVKDDRSAIELVGKKAIQERSVFTLEFRLDKKDQGVRWIKSSGRVMYNEKGEPQKLVGITVDITEQKLFTEELTRLVNERTLELQRSNDDLRQFAHVASHDLKEPVRKIQTFINRLKDEFAEEFPKRAQVYIEKTDSAAKRMYAMIDGVLNYSKVNSTLPADETVDLNVVISRIEEDLEVLMQSKKAVITSSGLPKITGSNLLMYQLFYNLILNSFKFSKESEPPLINISSTIIEVDDRKFYEILVSDNGIGFDAEYKEIIFKTFARLHTFDQYEGTGLGLALCRKIVERHQGTISASSIENEGATFRILLPVSQTL